MPSGGQLNIFRFARSLGPTHVKQAATWAPTGARFGMCAAILLVYYTDWKVVGRYIPYYGGRKEFIEVIEQ